MKLEDQVCSLELAKRLKELGVKQESVFVYYEPEGGIHFVDRDMRSGDIAAFTVAELGELLNPHHHAPFCSGPEGGRYSCWLMNNADVFYSRTEADARAKMLIYSIENNLIAV